MPTAPTLAVTATSPYGVVAALRSFLLATQESSGYRRRWFMWTFYILTALASLTKGLIAIVFPALIIASWIMLSGEWSILSSMYLPSGILLLLLIALPWHVLVARANPGFLSHYFIHGQFQRYLTPRDGPVPGPMTFIPVLLVGLFPWSAFLPQALRNSLRSSLQDIRQRKGVIFLFLWALLVFLFFSCSRYQDIPYILPAFPPVAILIARYFGKIWNNRASWSLRSGSWILLVALGLMTMVSVIAPQHYLERYSNWPTLEVPSEEGSIVSTRLTQYPDLGALTPYISVQTTILVIGTVTVLLVWMRRRGFPWCFTTVALSWAVFLVAVGSSLTVLDQRRSIKPLAIELGAILQPVDEVATYHTYYQDLPVYLRRPVTIVNWRGELQFEVNLQNTATSWAIDDATFWKRWEGLQRIYLLVDRTKFEQLSHDLRHKFFLVTETNYDVLLSNKDTLPTYAAPAVNGIRSG
jgi:Aminoarabinose transferase C-terminal domain